MLFGMFHEAESIYMRICSKELVSQHFLHQAKEKIFPFSSTIFLNLALNTTAALSWPVYEELVSDD